MHHTGPICVQFEPYLTGNNQPKPKPNQMNRKTTYTEHAEQNNILHTIASDTIVLSKNTNIRTDQ